MRERFLVVASVTVLALGGSALAATLDVNRTDDFIDTNPGDGFCAGSLPGCSLRAAIMEANALTLGPDTINLPAGHYVLTLAGAGEDLGLTGDLDILEGELTIEGDGAEVTIIDAGGIDRVIDVRPTSASVTLNKLKITGGQVAGAGGSGSGGGVLARGTGLFLDKTIVDRNRATRGGGIYFAGAAVSVSLSAVTNNVVEAFDGVAPSGGGLEVESPAEAVSVGFSTIAGNRCGPGGAAGCEGAGGVSLTGCFPGVTWPSLPVRVINSTVSGNTPRGVWLDDCGAWLESSTLVDNPGGGLGVAAMADPGWLLLVEYSILSGNGPDCGPQTGGTWLLAGNRNLDSDATCGLVESVDLPSTDPMLHPLGHFDPPGDRVASSHHPKPGSPVVDFAFVGLSPSDQDGYPRPQGARPEYDLGSIEVLRCDGEEDLLLENALPGATAGGTTIEACGTLTTGGAFVTVQNIGPVRFWAREAIAFGNGFTVVDGADFVAALVRWAGYVP